MFQFIHISLVKGDEIVRPRDWHRNETVTLREHVTKYKQTHAEMDGRISQKTENRGIRLASPNQ